MKVTKKNNLKRNRKNDHLSAFISDGQFDVMHSYDWDLYENSFLFSAKQLHKFNLFTGFTGISIVSFVEVILSLPINNKTTFSSNVHNDTDLLHIEKET